MNERRHAALQRWLETNRERVDVERGIVWSAKGDRVMGRPNKDGYLQAGLAREMYFMHEVVAVAGGLDIVGREVNHLNGVKTDNALSNLEAVSHQRNMAHAHASGLMHPHTGERNGRARLTWAQVHAIRAAYARGRESTALAAQYGMSLSSIERVLGNTGWRDAQFGRVSLVRSGERSPAAKLTWPQVRAIRAEYAAGGISQTRLAAKYGVGRHTINALLRGETWKESDAPPPWADALAS